MRILITAEITSAVINDRKKINNFFMSQYLELFLY